MANREINIECEAFNETVSKEEIKEVYYTLGVFPKLSLQVCYLETLALYIGVDKTRITKWVYDGWISMLSENKSRYVVINDQVVRFIVYQKKMHERLRKR